ncbi:MAG: ferric reductase-like transmembrane domain-containing protein [Chromatiaceae bacterium]|nr:ferric reductase-like transmembrane domain-containing protein [Chromatiaceae bacterium]
MPVALPGQIRTIVREYAIFALVVVTTILLWVMAKVFTHQPPDLWPWLAPSQILGLIAAALMAVVLMAGARSHTLEWMFGGLDRGIQMHRRVGLTALILVGVHLLLLVPAWIERGIPLADLFVPFYSPHTRTPDILITYAFVALAFLAYNKRLRYDRWQLIHRTNGFLFAVFAIRILVVPGSITEYEPLRTWMVFLATAGILAFLYRILLFNRFGPRYRYAVDQIKPRTEEIYDLVLRPAERRMIYDPGTFAFLSVPNSPSVPSEMHPFSFSSTLVNRDVRFSIRAVGDYTKALRDLPVGAAVDVYGPFGGFTPHAFVHYRRLVLIGSGIGITPFLSMLSFELTNNDFRRIWLYYVARNRDDAAYHEEIENSYLKADSYIDYDLWVTSERGRITAAAIAEDLKPIEDDYAVMLCGTVPFNRDLARQFRALGVPAARIIAEEFAFR